MSRYLLIESRSPWEAGDVAYFYGLAHDLAAAGNEVTLFLVQNGVLPARKGAESPLGSVGAKVQVLVDDFSLRERAVRPDSLIPGVSVSGVEAVVDLLAGGAKAVWH